VFVFVLLSVCVFLSENFYLWTGFLLLYCDVFEGIGGNGS
jgi:hypothetical protein